MYYNILTISAYILEQEKSLSYDPKYYKKLIQESEIIDSMKASVERLEYNKEIKVIFYEMLLKS